MLARKGGGGRGEARRGEGGEGRRRLAATCLSICVVCAVMAAAMAEVGDSACSFDSCSAPSKVTARSRTGRRVSLSVRRFVLRHGGAQHACVAG